MSTATQVPRSQFSIKKSNSRIEPEDDVRGFLLNHLLATSYNRLGYARYFIPLHGFLFVMLYL